MKKDISKGKAGSRSLLLKTIKVNESPRSPLLRRMQENEKEWAEKFKKKSEKSSLKKKMKIEKEAKIQAEIRNRKRMSEIQMLYDRIIASKKSEKIQVENCPDNDGVALEAGNEVLLRPSDSPSVPLCDHLENQSTRSVQNKPKVEVERLEGFAEGRLQSAQVSTNVRPKRIVFDAPQGNETKIGRID